MEYLDVNNSDWLKERECSWFKLEDYLSDDYSVKEISVIKDIFFKGKLDLGIQKHKSLFDEMGSVTWDFKFYPFKNENFWLEYVTKILPVYYSIKGRDFDIKSVIFSLVFFEKERTVYGWSVEEEVKAHNFFLGSRYKLGKIKFLDYEFENPIKPESVVMESSRNIRKWLGFVCEDNKYIHMLDYYFDAIKCLDKKYYSVEIMSGQDGWPQEMLQQLIHTVFNYDGLVLSEEYKKTNESVLNGDDYENNRRIVYAKMLADRFSELKEPSELFHLIEICRHPEFKLKKYRFKLKPVNLP